MRVALALRAEGDVYQVGDLQALPAAAEEALHHYRQNFGPSTRVVPLYHPFEASLERTPSARLVLLEAGLVQ